MPVLLAGSAYRRLWAARTVSQCGDVAQFTALALLVFQLTGSGLGVSGVVVAEIVPVLLLAPVAGPLADWLPRVTVMVGSDLARMVLAAVLAIWHGHIALVYGLAFGLSAGSLFFSPAAGSLLPALVKPGELVAANSGIWSAAVLSQVVIAPLAGLLTATAGMGGRSRRTRPASPSARSCCAACGPARLPGPSWPAPSGPRTAKLSARWAATGCCAPWRWRRPWPPCRRGRPVPCW